MSAQQKRETEFRNIWDEAKLAANKAGKEATPRPMGVYSGGLFNDSPVGKHVEVIDEGVCGFAWINIPGRSRFASFVKDNQYGRKSVYKGIDIWATALFDYNGQSMERKVAAMGAAMEVFTKYGLKGQLNSRMD